MPTPPPRVSLHCAIEEKLAWARSQAPRLAALRADSRVTSLLERVDRARAASRAAMEASGMIAICGECEERGGGSCCGAGIEDRYDGVTLLINQLLGAKLPVARRAESDCFFLGDEGCRLPARHVLCVNYVCDQLAERLDPERLAALREQEGEELEAIFVLHARITALLEAYDLLSPELSAALATVATFYDERPMGHVGPEGYRRTTVLADLVEALPRLLEIGAMVPEQTRFVDVGCGDGRVTVWAGYLAARAVGVEIEDWAVEEGNARRRELAAALERDGSLASPPVDFICGDSLGEEAWGRIARLTDFGFEDFDLFYTFLCLHQEVGALMAERARPGALLMVYGFDLIVPEIPGLVRLAEPDLLARRIVLYRKP